MVYQAISPVSITIHVKIHFGKAFPEPFKRLSKLLNSISLLEDTTV